MMERLTALLDRRPRTAEDWLARMGRPGVSARDQAAFLDWLEAEPGHLREYEQAKAAQAALEPLRGAFAPDLHKLSRRERPTVTPRRLFVASGLAAAGLAAAVVALPLINGSPQGRLYEAAPGRIVDVALDDGSRVTLDAGSAIRVAIEDDVRRVTLERGAAYFEVARDAAHPFQVAVADRRVIATGTRFVTALTGDGAEISLLEGRVSIGTRDAADRHALTQAMPLSPGERAEFRAGSPGVRKVRTDVEVTTAWRTRRLVFQDATLAEVIAAAGRYSEAPLVVSDPALARTRVTAVVPLEGDGLLADRLAALLPVTTERTADGRILVRAE